MKVNVSVSVKKSKEGKYELAKAVRQLTEQEIRKACGKLFAIANKRIRRLNAQHMPSNALMSTIRKDKVTGQGLFFISMCSDIKQLQFELQRCISFLNAKTSTVTGAKQVLRDFEAGFGRKLTNKQIEAIFSGLNMLRRNPPPGFDISRYKEFLQYVADEIFTGEDESENTTDIQAIIDKFVQYSTDRYEEAQNEIASRFRDSLSF